jgi:ATP-binding cassette subfamily B protein
MQTRSFPFYRQKDSMDCGPTCLRMVAKHYGKNYSLDTLREKSHLDKQGASLLSICDAAEAIGLRTTAALATYDALLEERPFPAIVHWRQNHFVVLYKTDKQARAYLADPAHGPVRLTREEFVRSWSGTVAEGEKEGLILFFEPSPEFYHRSDSRSDASRRGLREVAHYLLPYRRHIYQFALALVGGSILQFIFPFLTQSIVDVGIANRDIGFINLILLAQLMLFVGRSAGELIRNWILLHMGARINVAMVSDFLLKLTRLPIAFFDAKRTGDIMQRVNDHQRVQSFLTSSITNTVFSAFNLAVFAIILLWYSAPIFGIFVAGSALYVLWIVALLKKRRVVDYKRFEAMSGNQNNLIQLIQGMQEIKMNNAERHNRWKWERVQAKLFKVNISGLALDQYQQLGSAFIDQSKNILITFVAAKAVIAGNLTLGMMLSIQYIIGQLNGPVAELIGFIRSFQDAHISLERVGEIFAREDEEANVAGRLTALPSEHRLQMENVSFQYGGPHSPLVLKNINVTIPEGKVTAIVGASGSGKTTLLKLLLKFYDPVEGRISVGSQDLKELGHSFWRSQCGVVMQDGFVFSDTIAKNIAVGADIVDKARLLYAVKIASIQDFIEDLPLTYNTEIGANGVGISGGQRQRLLIARAVYKDPPFIFFDEATSSLDARNERTIIDNLETFFKGRTVIIAAHRLSTVKHADTIIVLEKGEVVEQGNHADLIRAKGAYYSLVKNQLELGSA